REDEVPSRLGTAARALELIRDLGVRRVLAGRLEGERCSPVEVASPRRGDLGVCDLTEAVVSEVVRAVPMLADHAPRPEVVEAAHERPLVDIGGLAEEREGEDAPDHGGRPRNACTLRGEEAQSLADHRADRSRHAPPSRWSVLGGESSRAQGLEDEERMALSFLEQSLNR